MRETFDAPLEAIRTKLNWVIIRIPFDVAARWGTRGQLRIKGDINGFPFRTTLFPSRGGGHMLLVNKKMQAGAKVRAGSVAQFRIEPDHDERVVAMPVELDRLLAEDRALRRWFDKLNDSTRKAIIDWVTQVKSADARLRRAEQITERLMATMDAERELPPLLKRAFGSDPRVMEGWNRMSLARRRGHLLGIFYYRTPEAQARRIAKTVQDAYEFAKKK